MEQTSVATPVQRGEVETGDLAVAYELVRRAYGDHRVRLRDPAPDFLFRARTTVATDISLDEVTYRASVEATCDPFTTVGVLTFRSGRYAARQGKDVHRLGAGGAVLVPADNQFDAAWDRTHLDLVQIPPAAIRRAAARLGAGPELFRFTGMTAISAEMNRHWLTTAAYLRSAFSGPDPAVAHPLVRQGLIELVAGTVLAVFPNTTMSNGHTTGPGRIDPKAVRRAVAYIDGHAGQPIACEDIAAAAGLSVRGLQAAFARHRDTTPTGYLRRVRLERAHRDLRAGDRTRGDTVEVIARRWGFPNAGRFAAEYRKIYGETPGHTLRT